MPAKKITRLILLTLLITILGISSAGSANAQQNSLGTIISTDARFKEFNTLVTRANLSGMLAQNGPFTVFAPTDAAITNLPAGTLHNDTLIRQAVLQHIMSGKTASDALTGTKKSALGQDLRFSRNGTQLLINGNVMITSRDIQATNGVIHVIDAVLLPPWVQIAGQGGQGSPGGATSSGSTTTGGGGANLPPPPVSGSGPTVVTISDNVLVAGAKRLGVNIGKRDQYGAANYIKNLIPNPGFESGEFAQIFIAWQGASGNRVQADNWETRWNNTPLRIGQLPGFWNGAQFEVLTGAGRGRTGTISNFTHEGGAQHLLPERGWRDCRWRCDYGTQRGGWL